MENIPVVLVVVAVTITGMAIGELQTIQKFTE